MKVLCLAGPSSKPGRITPYTFIDEEIRALIASGIEVHVVSTLAAHGAAESNVRVHFLPPGDMAGERRRTLAFLLRRARLPPGQVLRNFAQAFHAVRVERFAAEIVQAEGINVIHSHFGWPFGFGGHLARAETGVPLVASLRGMDLLLDRSIGYGSRHNPLFDAAVRSLLRHADRTVYATDVMRQQGISLGAPEERTVTIVKGVDLERFNKSTDGGRLREELGIRGSMILSVAGLQPRKGIDHTLRALGELNASHEFTFVVCGKGSELRKLQDLSRSLSLEEKTRFVGYIGRDKIPEFFAASDIFVLASLHEAAGNVILEAMASGRPVICTDCGGPPEYVEDGQTGFVVPVADPKAMAQRVRLLLEDPDLRVRMGARGRGRAEERLSYGRMIDELVSVYRDVAPLTPRAA